MPKVRVSLATLLVFALSIISALGVGTSIAAPVTIKWAHWYNNAEEWEADRQILAGFSKKYPDIKVEEVAIAAGQDYYSKVFTMIAGGVAPDVMWVQPHLLGTFVNNGALLDITDMIEGDEVWKAKRALLLPFIERLATYNGRKYGFTRDMAVVFLVYNRDAFDKAGLQYPNELRRQKRWTWDTFVEVCRKLTVFGSTGRPIRFGISGYNWWSAIRQNGGQVFSDDGSKVLIDSAEARGALQWLQDLVLKYNVAPRPGEAADWTRGQAVMGMGGVWMFAAWSKIDLFDWDMVEMPAGKAGPFNADVEGLGLLNVVSKTTKHPKEAYLLARYFAEHETQAVQAKTGTAFPIYKDLALQFVKGPTMPPSAEEILECYPHIVITDKPPKYREIEAVLNKYVGQITNGQIPVQQGVTSIMTEVAAIQKRK